MGWRISNKPKVVKATKVLANTFMQLTPAPGDRGMKPRRLAVYELQMRAVPIEFRPVRWALAHCLETRMQYRVDGKHTSFLAHDITPTPDLWVVLEEYTCDTLADVGRLYATFDAAESARTPPEVYLATARTIPGLANVTDYIITLSVQGISFYAYGGAYFDKKREEVPKNRADRLHENINFPVWLAPIMGTHTAKRGEPNPAAHLRRTPVIAAMFGAYTVSKKEATKFWLQVRDGTGASPELPDRKLQLFLATSSVNMAAGAKKAKAVSAREMYFKCVQAWNAWRRGEIVDLKYFQTTEPPAFE